jgi:lysozyme
MDRTPLYTALKTEEGVRRGVYKDSLGIYTRGVGFNVDADHAGGLDDEEIAFILKHRVDLIEVQAEQYPWYDKLDDVRKMVVLDMMYNLGANKFSIFHGMINAIASGDYKQAAAQMLNSLWAHQVGQRAVNLAKRMETGVWES